MTQWDVCRGRAVTGRGRALAMLAAGVVALVLAACGSSSSSGSGGASGGGGSASASAGASSSSANSNHSLAPIIRAELAGQTPAVVTAELNQPIPLTPGQAVPGFPNGVKPSSANIFQFSAADIAKLKSGHYTAAIAMHVSNAAWPELQIKALKTTLAKFGINVVAVTSADGVSSTQVSQLSTLEARKPTAIFSIPVNPVSEASAYKRVTHAGIKLVVLDNVPSGMAPGKDYVTVVSADNGGNGRFAAQQLLKTTGCGPMGFIGLDYYFPVVNARDTQAESVLKSQCASSPRFTSNLSNLVTTGALPLATATLTQHPDVKGWWAAWDSIAEEIVAAEKAQGKKIPIATTDVGPDSALSMAQGYITAIGAQQPYAQGVAEANALAYNLLGKKVPPFIELPTVPVTLQDLIPAYKIVNGSNPPANVIAAIRSAVGLS
jgi:ribose transport system substrate-binding protein